MAKNRSAEERDGEMLDADDEGGGSRVYELGFHLDPELPTEEVKRAYQALKETIETHGALVALGEPEKIPLAYTISRQETSGRRDFDSAYFAWIVYETSALLHEKILDAVKVSSQIIRFIDVLTNKDAARHASEMRLMAAKTAEPEVAPESVSNTELDAALESATL